MDKRKLKRIINEIKELEESRDILKQSGIYFNYDEGSVDNINILFIGPEDTPYEKGFYFFELTYPDHYPMIPPNMKYHTQGYLNNNKRNDNIKIRFNPNLYTNGKVCLSMLNTWKGPGWVPTNTITNILVAIQALVFNSEPLRNEPGFEHAAQQSIDLYSSVINYSNYKISVFDQLCNNMGKFEVFREEIKNYYKENEKTYDKIIDKLSKIDNKMIATPAYGMHVYLDYNNLKKYYEVFKTKMLV